MPIINIPHGSELQTHNKKYKIWGNILFWVGLSLNIFTDYWQPALIDLLVQIEMAKSTIANKIYFSGFSGFLLIAPGIYLILKFREKPKQPAAF
jgi:hypothetical protein